MRNRFASLMLGAVLMTACSTTQPAPQPAAVTPTPLALVTPTPQAAAPDPVQRVKDRVAEGQVSNGAKSELVRAWSGSQKEPGWSTQTMSDKPGTRVQWTMEDGQKKTIVLSWLVTDQGVQPENEAAKQLEAWVPSQEGSQPAFLAAEDRLESPPGLTQSSPEPTSPASPGPKPQASQSPPHEPLQPDGDETLLSNADLPPEALNKPTPKPTAKPGAKPSPKPQTASSGDLEFKGVMESDSGKKAVLSKGGQYYEVGVGESVGNSTVVSIRPNEVVLDRGGRIVKVTSKEPPPATAPDVIDPELDLDMGDQAPEPVPNDPDPFR